MKDEQKSPFRSHQSTVHPPAAEGRGEGQSATDAIGLACLQIQALDPHKTTVERFEVRGKAFKDACDRLGHTVQEIQHIDERLAE